MVYFVKLYPSSLVPVETFGNVGPMTTATLVCGVIFCNGEEPTTKIAKWILTIYDILTAYAMTKCHTTFTY